MAPQITLNELGTAFVRGVAAVLANKLMISMRRHHYGHEHEQIDSDTLTTVHFRGPTESVSRSTTDIEASASAMYLADAENVANADARRQYSREYDGQGFSESVGF